MYDFSSILDTILYPHPVNSSSYMYVLSPFVVTTIVESYEYEYIYFTIVPGVSVTIEVDEATGIVFVAVST